MIERALRLTREFHRMKQVELAKKLDISTSYLSEIESGKKPPSLELLESYAKIFKVPASTFLLFGEKTDPKACAHSARLLQFFEWVISGEGEQDDRAKEDEEATPARTPKKTVHTGSMRSLRN